MISSALLLLAAVNVARAQVSTASIVPVGLNEYGVEGQVVGTGAEGTTFVLSATLGAMGVPYTMTLVQDVSHISKGGLIMTSTVTIPYDVQCGLQEDGEAVCTEVLNSATLTVTQDVILEHVPVSTGTMTGVTAVTTFSNPGEPVPIATKTHATISSRLSGPDLPTTTAGSIFPPSGGDDGGLFPPGSDAKRNGLSALGMALLVLSTSLTSLIFFI